MVPAGDVDTVQVSDLNRTYNEDFIAFFSRCSCVVGSVCAVVCGWLWSCAIGVVMCGRVWSSVVMCGCVW